MAERPKFRTEHRPTGRTAHCPVCDQMLETTWAHTVNVADGRTVTIDHHDRFPDHPNPVAHGYLCCESGDPARDGDIRRARRHANTGRAA